MIKTFADRRTRDLYATGRAKRFPADVAKTAARKLEYIDVATRLSDLKTPPGNRMHALGGDPASSRVRRGTMPGQAQGAVRDLHL